MLLGPADDIRIDLINGSFIIIKSKDRKPSIVFSEFTQSGLYNGNSLIYSLPVDSSRYCNYINSSDGINFIKINLSADMADSLVFYKMGIAVDSIKFSQIGVPYSFVNISSGGWYRYWGGFGSNSGNIYSIRIEPTYIYLFGQDIPKTSSGKIVVDVSDNTWHIERPTNYVVYYGIIILILMIFLVIISCLKFSNKRFI